MLSQEFVERHKRRRFVVAIAELAHEFGIGEVTATGVCSLAHSARSTYYELFATSSEARRYAFGEAYERLFDPVIEATAPAEGWLEALSEGVGAFFAAVAAEPLLAELCLVHCFGKAEEAEGHDHQAGVEVMESLLGGAREAARATCGEAYREAPLLAEEYLARAIVSLAALRVRQGEAAALPGQRAEMVRLVVSAFFGVEEAGRAWRGFLTASVPVDV